MIRSLDTVHTQVKQILTEAEMVFRKGFDLRGKILHKQGIQLSTATLTETDIRIDAILRTRLQHEFPEIGFITEETDKNKVQEYNWIIDSVDGTANFAHKIPICGISIALWKGDNPLYGIVAFPILRETLHSYVGKGIFLNGKRVPQIKFQSGPFHYLTLNHVGDDKERIAVYLAIAKVTVPLNFSCATYQGCLTALGRTDGWIVVNLPIWDIAAVLLFAKEAGLHCEWVSAKPSPFQKEVRGYKNTFVIAKRELALTVANKIRVILKS